MQHRHDAQGPPMVAVSRSRSSCPKGTIAALLNSTACDGGSWHMRVRACERCNPACCCGKKQISSSPHGTCSRPCSTEVTEDRKHRRSGVRAPTELSVYLTIIQGRFQLVIRLSAREIAVLFFDEDTTTANSDVYYAAGWREHGVCYKNDIITEELAVMKNF
eukprot:969716-Pelagomonas_calceolata.AAC.1